MKKIALILAMTATVFAQEMQTDTPATNAPEQTMPSTPPTRKQAPCPKKEFAWGIGIVGIAVIGVVAGVTAGMASGN